MPHAVYSFNKYMEDLCVRSLSTIYSEDKVDHPFDEESDWGDTDTVGDLGDDKVKNNVIVDLQKNQSNTTNTTVSSNSRSLVDFDVESILGPSPGGGDANVEMLYDDEDDVIIKQYEDTFLFGSTKGTAFNDEGIDAEHVVDGNDNTYPGLVLTSSGDTQSMNTTTSGEQGVEIPPPLPPKPLEDYESSVSSDSKTNGKRKKHSKFAIIIALLALIGLIAVIVAITMSSKLSREKSRGNIALSLGEEQSEQVTSAPTSGPNAKEITAGSSTPAASPTDEAAPTRSAAPSSQPTRVPVAVASPIPMPVTAQTLSPTIMPVTVNTLSPTRMPVTTNALSPTMTPTKLYTDMPTWSTCTNVVNVNKSCYVSGEETIVLEVIQCSPRLDDWIGLYSEEEGEDAASLLDTDYVSWVLSCGSTTCTRRVYYIQLHVDGRLQRGHYRFYLARESSDNLPPYAALANSDQFKIVDDDDDESC